MKNSLGRVGAVILFLGILGIPAPAEESISLHLMLSELTEAGPPVPVENYILFTALPASGASYVALRFAHEDYGPLHVFKYNRHGIFFLLYPVPAGREQLKYRMVVDGVWMADPENPRYETDALGISYSLFSLPAVQGEELRSPLIRGRTVTFTFRYARGKAIYVCGDFNAFDPYLYRMEENKDGLYTLSLSLPPGEYGYYFMVDGMAFPDPLNLRRKLGPYNQEINTVIVF